jgi:cysteinyl-tRNA synthetase
LQEASSKEKQLKEFFLTIDSIFRSAAEISTVDQVWTEADRQLSEALRKAEADVHSALLHNFDYSSATRSLIALVSDCNRYFAKVKQQEYKLLLLKRIALYIDRMLRVFGVAKDGDYAFLTASSSGNATGSSGEAFAVNNKVMDAFSAFRDQIRASIKAGNDVKALLTLCDEVRDDILPALGIRLEDKPDGKSVWKQDDPVELLREKMQKLKMAKENELKKVQNQLKPKLKFLEKYNEAKIEPSALFTSEEDKKKYSAYDEEFTPTHDEKNEPLAKSLQKKLKKQTQQQQAAHAEYLNKLKEDDQFLIKAQNEVNELLEKEKRLAKEFEESQQASI